jgi:hypothetical protein
VPNAGGIPGVASGVPASFSSARAPPAMAAEAMPAAARTSSSLRVVAMQTLQLSPACATCTSPARTFPILFIPLARRPATVETMKTPLRLLRGKHLFASTAIVVFATLVIAVQVDQRNDFAGSQVAKDVESRWGAPVVQPAPSLRYVQSGTSSPN